MKKAPYKLYSTEKAKRINTAVKHKCISAVSSESEVESQDETILNHLQTQYQALTIRKEKLMMLTILPESWGIRKIVSKLNVPTYTVRQSKKLLRIKGVLSTPDQKPGKTLLVETVEKNKNILRK